MAVKIFFCYAHEDEPLLNELKAHLRPLQRQGLIEVWYDRDISAGSEWEWQIDSQLNTAQIILLLVSSDFMDSDYCYGIEMQRALERHEIGDARVIPIILRHVLWQGTPLGQLQALPMDAKPVISANWHNQDEAFFNVAKGIRKAATEMMTMPRPLHQQAPLHDMKTIIKQSTHSVSDILAIVKEAKSIEEQFIANGYTGKNDSPSILEQRGILPVVLSAPHAVVYPRKGKPREAQWHTGALTLQLAQLTGASALVYARTSDEDPNWGEPRQYKHKLASLVKETNACIVLDIHGLSDKTDKEVLIGTAYQTALLGRTELLGALMQAFTGEGIIDIAVDDKVFDAARPDTITLYTAQFLNIPAMQLGISWSLRNFGHAPKKYMKLLRGLCAAITSMSGLCKDNKYNGQGDKIK